MKRAFSAIVVDAEPCYILDHTVADTLELILAAVISTSSLSPPPNECNKTRLELVCKTFHNAFKRVVVREWTAMVQESRALFAGVGFFSGLRLHTLFHRVKWLQFYLPDRMILRAFLDDNKDVSCTNPIPDVIVKLTSYMGKETLDLRSHSWMSAFLAEIRPLDAIERFYEYWSTADTGLVYLMHVLDAVSQSDVMKYLEKVGKHYFWTRGLRQGAYDPDDLLQVYFSSTFLAVSDCTPIQRHLDDCTACKCYTFVPTLSDFLKRHAMGIWNGGRRQWEIRLNDMTKAKELLSLLTDTTTDAVTTIIPWETFLKPPEEMNWEELTWLADELWNPNDRPSIAIGVPSSIRADAAKLGPRVVRKWLQGYPNEMMRKYVHQLHLSDVWPLLTSDKLTEPGCANWLWACMKRQMPMSEILQVRFPDKGTLMFTSNDAFVILLDACMKSSYTTESLRVLVEINPPLLLTPACVDVMASYILDQSEFRKEQMPFFITAVKMAPSVWHSGELFRAFFRRIANSFLYHNSLQYSTLMRECTKTLGRVDVRKTFFTEPFVASLRTFRREDHWLTDWQDATGTDENDVAMELDYLTSAVREPLKTVFAYVVYRLDSGFYPTTFPTDSGLTSCHHFVYGLDQYFTKMKRDMRNYPKTVVTFINDLVELYHDGEQHPSLCAWLPYIFQSVFKYTKSITSYNQWRRVFAIKNCEDFSPLLERALITRAYPKWAPEFIVNEDLAAKNSG